MGLVEVPKIQVEHDGNMVVAVGENRLSKSWKNTKMKWSAFLQRIAVPVQTSETIQAYMRLSLDEQGRIKDKGGFVGGQLKKSGRRIKTNIENRIIIALDTDYAENFEPWERYKTRYGNSAVMYTTHKHTPEKPRYRICIRLAAPANPEESEAIGRMIASDLGIENFDPTTFQYDRLMYWPTVSRDGVYLWEICDGEPLEAAAVLDRYVDWSDTSEWPRAMAEKELVKKGIAQAEDPLNKKGPIGAFCRSYGIAEAIELFLPDAYTAEGGERYTFVGGSTSNGMVVYDDKFAYSHHATDPISNILCNVFDLVRIHKFGQLDAKAKEGTSHIDLPSYKAMLGFAANDSRTSMRIQQEREESIQEDFADPTPWQAQLKRNSRGELVNALQNMVLIMQNDEFLSRIVFNELADNLEKKGPMPWKNDAKFWRDADDAQLTVYIDKKYGTFTKQHINTAVTAVADARSYHPIREYYMKLPEWDGIPRLDMLLIDYFNSEDNPYIRAVFRKTLSAAVRRIYAPGTKFDYMPTLMGKQGIFKTTFLSKLGMEWYSDSLSLTDMQDKTAAEKLQGYLIMELSEVTGARKADVDKVKAFISRTDDKYRASYGFRVTPHPRQCVFIGTLNPDSGFLRDITGNRRFWPVDTPGGGRLSPGTMTQDDVDQIWAEAIVVANSRETLYLPADLENHAKVAQRNAMQQDEREGMVQEYLDTLLPEGWEDLPIYERRRYIQDPDDPTTPERVGVHQRKAVCNMEIWCECFGKRQEEIQHKDGYAISAIMARLGNWERQKDRAYIKGYGQQRVYVRDGIDN